MVNYNQTIHRFGLLFSFIVTILLVNCSDDKVNYSDADTVIDSAKQKVDLPAPFASKSVRNYCKVVGWPQGKTPAAPAGFKVSLYAGGLDNPRNILVALNGDVFCSRGQY